jgi:hypothetical protein
MIYSIKTFIDSVRAAGRPYLSTVMMRNGENGIHPDTIIPTIEFVPISEFSDFVPPIRSGTAKADRDNNLWLLPTTSLQAKGGLLYDVVNIHGELFERVQLPIGRDIVGFGAGGVLYLSSGDVTKGFRLERTYVVGPARPQ